MHQRNLRIFAVLFLVLVFNMLSSVDNSYSLSYSCLLDLTNGEYRSMNDDYACTLGFNFTDLKDAKLDCNGNYLDLDSSGIIFDNTSMVFIDCDLRNSIGGLVQDSSNTNITFLNSGIFNTLDFTSSQGNYTLSINISLDIQDRFSNSITGSSITNVTLLPMNTIYSVNDDLFNVINKKLISGFIAYDVENITLEVFNSELNSSNSTYIDSFITKSNKIVSLKLEDRGIPYQTHITPIYNESGINFTIGFNEDVKGNLEIRDSMANVLNNIVLVSTTDSSISDYTLSPYEFYTLFVNITDMSNNSYTKTFDYQYIVLNLSHSIDDDYSYTGNPQNTTSFNFSSLSYDIEVEFLESVNLSMRNLSEEIIFTTNSVHINSSSGFNKAAKLIFKNLPYTYSPIAFKDNILCGASTCMNKTYSSGDFEFRVSSFSNYSIYPNSRLEISNTTPYIGKEIIIYANYTNTSSTQPIFSATCNLIIDSISLPMQYNSSSKLFHKNVTYNTYARHDYDVECFDEGFEYSRVSSYIDLIYQPVDNFRVSRSIVKKDNDPYLTKVKSLNITITSDGMNNTGNTYDTNYYFMVSKDYPFNSSGYTDSKNVTGWVNIEKEEFFTLKDEGEANTIYEFSNSTQRNISEFIFFDDGTTSYYINIKACVPGGYCKYNSSNYYIFLDTTPPQYFNKTYIPRYYDSSSNLEFDLYLRDLESGIDEARYGVNLSTSPITINHYIPFVSENAKTTVSDSGFNFKEGKFYRIKLESFNKRLSSTPSYNYSDEFLIDTIPPHNSSFNITLNSDGFTNKTEINFNFDLGVDYHINYSLNNMNYSGIDYMAILLKNGTLSNGMCSVWQTSLDYINKSFNLSDSSHVANFSSFNCYNISYAVFDKAGNYNYTYFSKIVKIDDTKPDIVQDIIENPPNRVEKNAMELSGSTKLFDVNWDIEDLESGIDQYEIKLYDNTTSSFVKNFTINSSSLYSFDVYYNSSYIKDGHTYMTYVRARNNADLYSDYTAGDGVSFYILKTPYNLINDSIILESSFSYPQHQYYKILNTQNTQNYSLDIYENMFYDTTCRWNVVDFSYSEFEGNLCDGSNTPYATCNLNLSLSDNFYISCLNDEYVQAYNDESNNLDIEIYTELNTPPYIVGTNNGSIIEKVDLLENELLNLSFDLYDNNTFEFLSGDFSLDYDNLEINYSGTEIDFKNRLIVFVNDTQQSYPSLEVLWDMFGGKFYHIYTYNGSINYSEIISLNDAENLSILNIGSSNLSQRIYNNFTINISNSTYDAIYSSGLSNTSYLIDVDSPYNITNINNTLYWNLSNSSIRKDIFNITFTVGDKLENRTYNITLNISPIYHPPKLNESYYNLQKNFSLNQYGVYEIDASKYVYEDNTLYGLDDKLEYDILSDSELEIYNMNYSSGKLIFSPKVSGNFSSKLLAKNSIGEVLSLELNFTINSTVDNSSPKLDLFSPLNSSSIIQSSKSLFFNISSDENLSSLKVNLNNITYRICDIVCDAYFDNYSLPNLLEGINNLTITAEDIAGNTNSTLLQINFTKDSDLDGIADISDTDADGDSYNDSNESVIYSASSFDSNLNLQLYVNKSDNYSKKYNGTYDVIFKDNITNITYVKFDYNFSRYSINFLSTHLKYSPYDNYFLISNLENVSNKTIFIPKTASKFKNVCIKDSEVFSIDEMSSECLEQDEILLDCSINQTDNKYSCSEVIQNDSIFYKVSGMNNSALKLMCMENWMYGEWSSCVSGSQIRTGIIDINNCGTTNLKVDSRSCTIDNIEGGSGGGGGGGSSSSDSSSDISIVYNDTNTNSTVDDSQDNETINETDSKSSDQYKIEKISLGDLGSITGNKVISENQFYSFSIGENSYSGYFTFTDDGILFEDNDSDYTLSFSEGENLFDTDDDSEDDTRINLEFDGSNYLLNFEGIEKEISEEIETEEAQEFPENSEEEQESGFNYMAVAIFLVILIVMASGGFYYSSSYKKKKENKNPMDDFKPKPLSQQNIYRESQENKVEVGENKNIENKIGIIPLDRNIVEDKLESYSQMLKEIVESEKDLFDELKKETRYLVREGYAWIDIYYYLKGKGISRFFIDKIVDISYLVYKFEVLYKKEKFSELTKEDMSKKLLETDWFKECYIYHGDGKNTLENILTALDDMRYSGFSKEKMKLVLIDEYEYGIKNKNPKNFKFSHTKLNTSNINILLELQDQISYLKSKVLDLRGNFSDSISDSFMEARFLTDDLLNSINKHLD